MYPCILVYFVWAWEADLPDADVAFSRAYQICSDQTAVAKPNGGTITATLRFGPQSGVLTFAPITSSATPLPIPTATDTTITATDTDTSSSSSSSTLSFTETTLTTATPTSSFTRTTTTSSTSRAATTSTAASTPTSTQDAPPSAPPLSKGQIAGISIGAVCIAAGVAFGLILLVRFLLRRRRRHSGSTIGSFVGGGHGGGGGRGGGSYRPARDTWGYGFDKTSHSSDRSSWIAREAPGMSRYPAMPAPSGSGAGGHATQQQQQQPYNRDSWRPSAIGLAISPSKVSGGTPAATPTRLRPLSKLLPAKPDMPPVTPKTTSPPPAMRPAYQEGRGDQAPLQPQAFLHPIAAQFMRPAAAAPAPQPAATNNNNQRPYSLRLVIPDDSKPSPAQDKQRVQSRPPQAGGGGAGRDSTLTEFEEDELRRSTSPSAGQIWCPPSAGPDSAAATAAPYYVSDGYGNWVLGDTKNALDREMQSPLSAGTMPRVATARSGIVTTAVQTQIPARRSREPLVAAAAAAAEETTSKEEEDQIPGSIQNTPKVLAAAPRIPADQAQKTSVEEQEAAPAEDPKTPRVRSAVRTPKTVPSPLFSRQPNPRSASNPLPNINTATYTAQGRSLTAGGGRSRATSADSGITAFSIGSDGAADDSNNNLKSPLATTPGPVNNLSPVAESPRSRATAASHAGSNDVHTTTSNNSNAAGPSESNGGGGGVSPVSYPRIPGRGAASGPLAPRGGGRAHFSGVAPSRMLLLNQQESGQPSPTLGRESFQRRPPYLPYGGAPPPEAAARYSRGGGNGMSRGRGRGGPMTMMMRPPSQNSTMGGGGPLLRPPSQNSLAQQQRTGSPTMRIVEPSPEPEPLHATTTPASTAPPPPRDDRSMLPSAAARQPRRRPPSHLPHPFPMYPQPRPPRAAQPAPPPQEPTIPSISTDRDSFSRYPGHPMPIPQPYQHQHQHEAWRPTPSQQSYNPAAHDNSSQEALAATSTSSPSSSSLLLAKRLGTTRAANMTLQPQQQQQPQGQRSLGIRDRWQQSPQQTQQGGGGGGGGVAGRGGGDGRTLEVHQVAEYPATPDLPSTPTWLPRLTPTRRGEDLVLSVG